MSAGNFRTRLFDAVTELATSSASIRFRLQNAILNHLILANTPECYEVPSYFREFHKAILDQVSTKSRNGQDKVRASLEGRHGKTLEKIATQILTLHREYEEYLNSGFIPTQDGGSL
jgi:predicted choloylglycine hydrolase